MGKPVKEKVIQVIGDQLSLGQDEIDEINDETKFDDDLGTDSLDRVELLMALEEEFDIEIADELAMEIKTVGQAVAMVEEILA